MAASCFSIAGPAGSLLLSDASHYVFPDAGSMVQDLELYQHPAITGLVVTQTAAANVSDALSSKPYRV